MVLLIFVMTTLEYYWADGTHTTLGDYIRAAARYLKDIGYTAASDGTVHYALNNDVVRYGRTWVYA